MRSAQRRDRGIKRGAAARLKPWLVASTFLSINVLIGQDEALAAVLEDVTIWTSEQGTRIELAFEQMPAVSAALDDAGRVLKIVADNTTRIPALFGSPAGIVKSASGVADANGSALTFELSESAQIDGAFVLPPGFPGGPYLYLVEISTAPVGEETGGIRAATRRAWNSGVGDCPSIELIQESRAGDGPAFPGACPPQPYIDWKGFNLVEVGYPHYGVTLRESLRQGADVLGALKHVYADGLEPQHAWRSELDATISIIENGDIDAALMLGLFDSQRPVAFARGGAGVEPFARWRTNSVADAGVKVTLFENRAVLTSGFASSESWYGRDLVDEPWLRLFDPASLNDRRLDANAAWHALKVDLFDRETLKGAFEITYTDAEQDFRSFQSSTLADIIYEGATLSAKTSWKLGSNTLEFVKETHRDANYAFNRNRFKIKRGALQLRGAIEAESAGDAGALYYDDELLKGEVAVDLKKMMKTESLLLPDQIRVGFTERSAVQDTLFASAENVRRSIGAGFTKSGHQFLTDVYVYWNMRNDFSEVSDFAASRAFGIDVTQSVFGDSWDFTLYASMSDLERERRFLDFATERVLSGGASFSKKFETLPDVTLNFDAFKFDTDYVRDDFAFQNHDLSISAQIDVSELLWTGKKHVVDKNRPLTIQLAAYHGWEIYDDTLGAAEREDETRVLLMLRRKR